MRILRADVAAAKTWLLPDGSTIAPDVFARLSIATNQPVLLGNDFKPSPVLTQYLLERCIDLKVETAFQYAYELRLLADFLSDRRVDFITASSLDLRKYRKFRLEEQENPIAPSSWARNAAAIRGLFSWMVEKRLRADTPLSGRGARGGLWGPAVPDEKIRALDLPQWRQFRDVGIRGYAIDGSSSARRLLSNSGRLHLGAELALTTGMRLQEFSSLLLPEVSYWGVPKLQDLKLQAVAKFGNYRVVHLIPRLLRQAELYVRTERPFYAQRKVQYYENHSREYFRVESFDRMSGKIVGVHDGLRRRFDMEAIDTKLRARMIHEGPFGLESMCLFLSRTGEPLGRHSWFKDFRAASRRAFTSAGAGVFESAPEAVKPHDLRHTFAVRLLRHSMINIRQTGVHHSDSLHDHLVWNPILTIQRLLGHRQPSTTLKYLRYVQDLDEVLIDAWEGWDDPELSFADYADFLLNESETAR